MDDLDLDVLGELLDADDNLPWDNAEAQGRDEQKATDEQKSCQKNSSNSNEDAQSIQEMEARIQEMQKKMQILQEELNRKKTVSPNEEKKTNGIAKSSGVNQPKQSLIETDIFAQQSEAASSHKPHASNQLDFNKSVVHGQGNFSSDEESEYLSAEGRTIKRRLAHSAKYNDKEFIKKKEQATWKTLPKKQPTIKEMTSSKTNEKEFYSGLNIINPLVPLSTIQSRMEGRKMVRMSLIHCMMKDGDIEGDWVTIGVIIAKVPPKVSKTGKTFSIWKMSDLRDCSKLISMFLFGEVHQQHWKTSVGTVVGFLNPSIMSQKEDSKYNDLSLSLDHPGKVMLIGTSKDLGFCKSQKKSGDVCGALVNLSVCDVCDYHVQARYRKLSARRSDLQGTFSGVQPRNLKSKILSQQQIMYGGQIYVAPPVRTPRMLQGKKQKNQLTLESLKLQCKAKELQKVNPSDCPKNSQKDVSKKTDVSTLILKSPCKSASLPKLPCAGNKAKVNMKSVTPKELLKMQQEKLKMKQNVTSKITTPPTSLSTSNSLDFRNYIPQLGKGILPGEDVCLDVAPQITPQRKHSRAESAKLKAIEKIRTVKGRIEPSNPNAVKKKLSPELREKIRKKVEGKDADNEFEKSTAVEKDGPPQKRPCLGKWDMNAAELEKILNRKSSHSFEVEQEELERQEKYFSVLEKKEQMELKMESIKEIQCDVISCKQCNYTAYQPTELCKTENHHLVRHKATKKFFRCTLCSHRTFAFTKLPTTGCKKCGESKFERTSMMKPRNGPKLDNETLLIRGEEVKFLNSMKN